MRGGNYLAGVYSDIRNWSNFLQSNIGGAWEDNEIKEMIDPTDDEVCNEILSLNCDYTFITYSGHGFFSSSEIETKICLRNSNDIDTDVNIIKLKPLNSRRTTIILDSCRGIEDDLVIESAVPMLEHYAHLKPKRIIYRQLFDYYIQKSERGINVLYSCSIGESANEKMDGSGGYFTSALIDAALEMDRIYNTDQVLYINKAFYCASDKMRLLSEPQHPKASFGRRLHYFPFAVFPKSIL